MKKIIELGVFTLLITTVFFCCASMVRAVANLDSANLIVTWSDNTENISKQPVFSGNFFYSENARADFLVQEAGGNRSFTFSCEGNTYCDFSETVETVYMHNTQWQISDLNLHSYVDSSDNYIGSVGNVASVFDTTGSLATLESIAPSDNISVISQGRTVNVFANVIDYGSEAYAHSVTLDLPSGANLPSSSITLDNGVYGGGVYNIQFDIPQGTEVGQGTIDLVHRNNAGAETYDMDFATINFSADGTSPIVTEIAPVASRTADNTPDYEINTTEDGTLTFGGTCAVVSGGVGPIDDPDPIDVVAGDNTITFHALANGTYSDCTVIVTDSASNASDPLSVTEFTVDTTGDGDDEDGGEDGDDGKTVGEVDIPKPELKLSGKLKDKVLSSKRKIYINKDELKFKGEFDDLKGGAVKIKYKRGSKSYEVETGIGDDGTWKKTIDFKKDGSHKIKFTFYDKYDNEIGSKGYYKVKIDTDDPEIASMPHTLTKRIGDKVWWEATDDEGVKKYKYIFNGKKTKTKDAFFHIPEGTPRGPQNLEIRAYDKAGNKDVKNVTIIVR